ncbi:MAG: phosphate acyltransferase PlsX [Thermoleophilia bacterium]
MSETESVSGGLVSRRSARPVVLALDAEGGDRGPAEIIRGAAAVASPQLEVLLVGRPEVVEPLVQREREAAGDRELHLRLVAAQEVISSDEEPARAVRAKPEASIPIGARLVAEGRAHGFVSAGSTGAMLAAGLLVVKRVKGIKRPAITTILPGLEGPVVFLDAGANADCRAEHLVEFALLGSVFARLTLGIEEPRVGLLNIGEEPTKGSELALEAHKLLAESGLNFRGNVEGRDLLSNAADVVVTDGFTGNVALKLLEGAAQSLFTRIRAAAESGPRAKMGGLLLRPALKELRSELDPETYGGTYLLGLRGLMVICHGNSSSRAVSNALRFGAEAAGHGIVQAVERGLAEMGDRGLGTGL